MQAKRQALFCKLKVYKVWPTPEPLTFYLTAERKAIPQANEPETHCMNHATEWPRFRDALHDAQA